MALLSALQNASRDGSFATALPLWRRTELVVALRPDHGFEAGPSLPQRLRGAFGHALMSQPQWQQAREVFFADAGQWRPRAELPKPFVIAAERLDDVIEARLTLFGFADAWRQAAFDGFLQAFADGIAVSGEPGAQRFPMEVLQTTWSRSEGVALRVSGAVTRLLFRTPVRLGPQEINDQRYGNLIVSLAERVAGMALWQGVRIDPRLGDWRELSKSLVFRDHGLFPANWKRRSGKQGGRLIPMNGMLGHLDIERPPETLLPLLALGETTHVGGGAALGLGRFELL